MATLIEKRDANELFGIAWDDDYGGDSSNGRKLARIVDRLREQHGVVLKFTNSEKEFESWLQRPPHPFQFIVLDIIRNDEDVLANEDDANRDVGIELYTKISSLRTEDSEFPLVFLTSLPGAYLELDIELKHGEYFLSKRPHEDYIADDLVKLLQETGIRLRRKSIAVIANESSQVVNELSSRLDILGFTAELLSGFGQSKSMRRNAVKRLNGCSVFVFVMEGSPTSDFLLNMGLALALPRGQDRSIFVGSGGFDRISWVPGSRCLPIESLKATIEKIVEFSWKLGTNESNN